MRWPATVAIALLVVAGAARAGDDRAERFAVEAKVTPVTGAPVQRVKLPVAILAGSRSVGLSDVRLLDTRGQALSVARVPPVAETVRNDTPLRALPVLGDRDTKTIAGVSLRFDHGGQVRLAPLGGEAGNSGAATVAVLFDARRITAPGDSLTLDADWPASQPVSFVAEASDDLLHWRTIGQQVVFRASGARGEMPSIALHDATPGWIRVSWQSDQRLMSPVLVRAGTITIASRRDMVAQTLDATAPTLAEPHLVEFVSPFVAPLSAVQIIPAAAGGILPLRILARDNAEQPWQVIGSGTAYRVAARGGERVGDAILLDNARFRFWRIEVDKRGPGFATPPLIRFTFVPAEIAFVASGQPPLRLVAGRAGQADNYLPLTDVMAASGVADASALPVAGVAAAAPARVQLAGPDQDEGLARKLVLWGLLLAATTALGFMAWRLSRRPALA